MSFAEIDAFPVFRLVVVNGGVSLVVPRLTDQPRENALGVRRIRDARLCVLAVEREDVVPRDRPPVDIAVLCPPLDPSEQAFDAWPITTDRIPIQLRLVTNGYEILGPREDKDIRFLGIGVAR